jgi:hypothetical protein
LVLQFADGLLELMSTDGLVVSFELFERSGQSWVIAVAIEFTLFQCFVATFRCCPCFVDRFHAGVRNELKSWFCMVVRIDIVLKILNIYANLIRHCLQDILLPSVHVKSCRATIINKRGRLHAWCNSVDSFGSSRLCIAIRLLFNRRDTLSFVLLDGIPYLEIPILEGISSLLFSASFQTEAYTDQLHNQEEDARDSDSSQHEPEH